MQVNRKTQGQTTSSTPQLPPAAKKVIADIKKLNDQILTTLKQVKKERDQEISEAKKALKGAHVPQKEADEIARRLATRSADDLGRDVALLKDVAKTPNADRAARAWLQLDDQANASPAAKERLPQPVREMLVRGVAEPRTYDAATGANARGLEGVLGVKQAKEAAQALTTMPQAQYDDTLRLLSRAGHGAFASPRADPQAERSLILKAVAARAPLLAPQPSDVVLRAIGVATLAEQAMGDVAKFAADIQGMGRAELIRDTAGIDVEDLDTSATDPLNPRAKVDSTGNDDGIYQRYGDTCAPTTGEIVRAEADPVFALQAHRELAQGLPIGGQLASTQLAELQKNGGNSVDVFTLRNMEQDRQSVVDKGRALGVPELFLHPLWLQMTGQKLGTVDAANAEVARAWIASQSSGFPSKSDLANIASIAALPRHGMDGPTAITDVAGDATHVSYQELSTKAGPMTKATILAVLPAVEQRLRDGQDVPMGVGTNDGSGGHVLTMTDVRGHGDNTYYELADPNSGRTIWAKKQELLDGSFMPKLGLNWPQVTGFLIEK